MHQIPSIEHWKARARARPARTGRVWQLCGAFARNPVHRTKKSQLQSISRVVDAGRLRATNDLMGSWQRVGVARDVDARAIDRRVGRVRRADGVR